MKHYSETGYIIDHSIWLTPKIYAKVYGCGLQTLYNKKSSGDLERLLPEDMLLTDGRLWWIHKDAKLPFAQKASPEHVHDLSQTS